MGQMARLLDAAMPKQWLAGLAAVAFASFSAASSPAHAIEFVSYEVQAERSVPSVCLRFSEPLQRGTGDRLAPFIELQPAAKTALSTRDRDLCISGLAHGTDYRIRLRRGL